MDLFVVYDTKGSGRVVGVFDDLSRAQSVAQINRHYFRLRQCTLNSINSEIVRWALNERERSGLGQQLDVSMQAAVVWTLMNATGYPPNTGGDPPGTGRRYAQKVLKINFSRPGDEYLQRETEIHLGLKGQVDWEWIYR